MPARKRSIIIVDADPFLAGLYARRFEAAKWHTRVAESVQEAATMLKRKQPDAVMIDTATVAGALEWVREVVRAPAPTPVHVVALTAIGDRSSVAGAYAAGAQAYILKGHFVPSEIIEKLDRLVVTPLS